MALEREARTNIMGSSLDIRNRNWSKVDDAMAVEQGGTTDNWYIRYGNGLQICRRNVEYSYNSVDSTIQFSYAQSFKEVFSVGVEHDGIMSYTEGRARAVAGTLLWSTTTTWNLRTRVDPTDYSATIQLFAIGTWK